MLMWYGLAFMRFHEIWEYMSKSTSTYIVNFKISSYIYYYQYHYRLINPRLPYHLLKTNILKTTHPKGVGRGGYHNLPGFSLLDIQ